MKLYAFYYQGFGNDSYFVVAENEEKAREYVDKMADNRVWPDRYTMEVFDVGQVATHQNS